MTWDGRKYAIPADRMMMTIARVEDIITMGELSAYFTTGRLPLAKLSQAFGIVLRTAGANVDDDQVYEGMFRAGGKEVQRRAVEAIGMLMQLMIPPAHLRAQEDASASAKKPEASGVTKSSRKRSSSQPRRRGG